MVTVPPPPRAQGRDSPARARARQALVDVLWRENGARRLPHERDLTRAIAACARLDARDVWWVCEASSAGPVYLLPTREWMGALCRVLDDTRARSVLEVAAGDGFLAACIRRRRPQLRVIATDSGAWSAPHGRMTRADRRRLAGVPLAGIAARHGVLRMAAAAAIARFRPDVTLVSWPPPGALVTRAIRGPTRFVLEIGADGDVCGDARALRFHKELLDGPVEHRALCRLDSGVQRATRVTLYYGARHADHGVDRASIFI